MFIYSLITALLFLNPLLGLWGKALKNRNAARAFLAENVLRYVTGVIVSFFIFYVGLIDFTWHGILNSFAVIIILNLILSATASFYYYDRKVTWSNRAAFTLGCLAAVGMAYMWLIYPMQTASDRHALPQAETEVEVMESADEENIRVVPYGNARYRSEIVFGDLDNSARYHLGESSIQTIDDELFWVSPIEFDGFFRWLTTDHVPGYIKISAEDPNDQAELVSEYEMSYVPSAYFGSNAKRMVRQEHEDIIIVSESFEPDDDGHPYYVFSYGYYEFFRHGNKADGVVVLDAVTGEMERYSLEDMPEFIDQGVAEQTALNYATWYGQYGGGFINRFIGRDGVTEPRRDEMIGVFGAEREMYWFVDHERPRGSGNTMVGFSMVNARTGEMTYYGGQEARGILNGNAARDRVDRAFERERWVGTQPVLYSIYGQYTWVVPVVDRNNGFQKIALVHADSGRVVSADSRREVFNEYQNLLATGLDPDMDIPTDLADEVEETLTVERVTQSTDEGGTIVMILFEERNQIFTVPVNRSQLALFIEPGDELLVEYIDTGENMIAIQNYSNLSLNR
ncbi:type II secretion system protein M [Alteribacter natronophilus]|uniref:type II secretion system protein M n=1 Tax=Alteribacter natronophilus TaxID=2583810 RepID=UPI00110D417C|nr:type II secretion system protein M [Alteribacter natronophilus]TMW72950.1 type II secretion system protein M [Alteribacter natronophilus]